MTDKGEYPISVEYLIQIFNNHSEAVAVMQLIFDEIGHPADYRILGANEGVEKMFGCKREHVIGRKSIEFMPAVNTRWIKKCWEVVRSGQASLYEVYSASIGCWYNVKIYSLHNENKFMIIVADISRQKALQFRSDVEKTGYIEEIKALQEAKRILQTSERKYHTLFKSIDEGFCIMEKMPAIPGKPSNYRFLDVNPAFERQTGLTGITGKMLLDVMPGIDKCILELYDRAVAGGQTIHTEVYVSALERWLDINAFCTDKPQLCRVAVLFRDITERKNMEKYCSFHANILSAVNEAIFATDENFKITYWNRKAQRLYGWSEKEVLGKDSQEVFKTEFPGSSREESIARLLDKNCFDGEVIYHHKDGRPIFTECHAKVFRGENGEFKGFITAFRDINDRKNVEQQLKFQKELLEAVIENIPQALAIYDSKGNAFIVNAAARGLYPKIADGNVKNVHAGFDCLYLDESEIPREKLPTIRACKGEKISHEIIVIKCPLWIRYTEVNATQIYDSNHLPKATVVTHHDVTQMIKNQQEIRRQQVELLDMEREKNAALERSIRMKDEFLSLVSHEFKTPLAVIISAIQLLEQLSKDEKESKSRRFLAIIRQNCNRQIKLVNNLLDLTRINAGRLNVRMKDIDIVLRTKLITESICIYAEQKELKLTFTTTLKEKIIAIDEEMYERVLLNLLSNAVKFTPKGKAVTVSVSIKNSEHRRYVCIRVKDEGIGIPGDKQEIIFKRFGQADTFKSRQAEGTGIGLHLVKNLVGMMNGSVSLESKPDRGSTFTLLFPAKRCKGTPAETLAGEEADSRIIRQGAIEFSDIYF